MTPKEVDVLKHATLACLFDAQNAVEFAPRALDPAHVEEIRLMFDSVDRRLSKWIDNLATCEELGQLLSVDGSLSPVELGIDTYATGHEAAWRFAKDAASIVADLDLSYITESEWISELIRRLGNLPSSQHLEARIVAEHGEASRLVAPILRPRKWFRDQGLTDSAIDGQVKDGVLKWHGKRRNYTLDARAAKEIWTWLDLSKKV